MSLARAILSSAVIIVVCPVACYVDRGHLLVVSRPIFTRIARACAASVLVSDARFRTPDTIAKPWLIREQPNAIGTFSWASPRESLPDEAGISQTNIDHGDTLKASTAWVGLEPSKVQIAIAESAMSHYVNTIADSCGTPAGGTTCTYIRTGDRPLSCAEAQQQ